jgi:hypothetical protein
MANMTAIRTAIVRSSCLHLVTSLMVFLCRRRRFAREDESIGAENYDGGYDAADIGSEFGEFDVDFDTRTVERNGIGGKK